MHQSSTKLIVFIKRQAGYKQCLVKFCSRISRKQHRLKDLFADCSLSTLLHEIKRHSFARNQKKKKIQCITNYNQGNAEKQSNLREERGKDERGGREMKNKCIWVSPAATEYFRSRNIWKDQRPHPTWSKNTRETAIRRDIWGGTAHMLFRLNIHICTRARLITNIMYPHTGRTHDVLQCSASGDPTVTCSVLQHRTEKLQPV